MSSANNNQLSRWIMNSNEALRLSVVKPSPLAAAPANAVKESFSPTYTYPIFGEEEKIFGYQGLDICLSYAAGSLETHLGITYKAKLGDSQSTESLALTAPPENVLAKLTPFLPEGFSTANYDEFLRLAAAKDDTFKPMGEKIGEYTLYSFPNAVFELYKCTFETPRFKEYHRRLQLFLLFFIEAASYIEETDEAWEVILVFEKTSLSGKAAYAIVGYVTLYPFYYHPDQIRMRISQYFVMPHYQGKGHGSKLYSTVYSKLLTDKNVAQITVEDPNESFDDLRDRCDLTTLLKDKVLEGVRASTLDKETMRAIGKKYKLSQRQLERCCEMLLYRQLKKQNVFDYRDYRLFVKRRLYIRNKEALESVDEQERIEKLHATYEGLEEDYRRILASLRI